METVGKYTPKRDSYISTILEAEEQYPLTWQRTDLESTVESENGLHMIAPNQNPKLARKKENVKLAFVSCDKRPANHHCHLPFVCCLESRRNRKPEMTIVSIALVFIFLLLGVMFISLYFEFIRESQYATGDSEQQTTHGFDKGPTTTTFYSSTDLTTISTASLPYETTAGLFTSPVSTLTSNNAVTVPITTISQTTAETTSDLATTRPGTIQDTTKKSSTVPETPESTSASTTTTSIDTTYELSTHYTSTILTSMAIESTTSAAASSAFTESPEATTVYGQFTTFVEETPPDVPIFYISGPFSYPEARQACEKRGATLALKRDLSKAWNKGYNRCTYGWLRDMHTAMIMQEQYASIDCDKGGIGVLYKPAREPNTKFSGTYCTKEDSENFEVASLKIASDPNKTINWWVTIDPSDSFNLRRTLMTVKTSSNQETTYPLLRSMKSLYTCCNAFNISFTDEDNPRTLITTKFSAFYLREVIKFYRREMAPAKIYTHITTSYEAMIKHGAATTHRSETISSLVEMALDAGLDGLIMDYEPRKNYTREHAEAYRIFLDDFHTAMKEHNMTLSSVISSWGILKFYDIYARSKVEFMGSMGSTYYGHDLEKNQENVLAMMESIEANRLEIGLGLMHEPGTVLKANRNYRWNEDSIRTFMSWTRQQGISRYHVYPGQWRQHLKSEEYFLQALAHL